VMMRKKRLPHILAVVALATFVALGLASDGTTPPPSGGGGGGGGGGGQVQRVAVTFENRSNQVVTVRFEGMTAFTVPAFASHTGRPGTAGPIQVVAGRTFTHSPSSVQVSGNAAGTHFVFR
ncbi:MAG: hypothetical protein FWD88_05350, partial [Treponema sp.]|nr:hypothetical protein [Treponema sp.]